MRLQECRNALIHSGGLGNQSAVDRYNDIKRIPEGDLGLSGPLELPAVTLNKVIELSLPDVVAFSSIAHRMIITLDAAMSVSTGSETHMVNRIQVSLDPRKKVPVSGSGKRHAAIRSLARSAGVPVPANIAELENLLTNHGVL